MSLATQTSTPPTAEESSLTALKSAIMKWVTFRPVSFSTVRQVQPGSRSSWPRDSLKRTPLELWMVLVEPSFCLVGQSGMSVIMSRGMDSAVAFVRSSETWKSRVVSACPTLPASP